VTWNFGVPQLYEHSFSKLKPSSAFLRGRAVRRHRRVHWSPKDKFTVRDATTETNMWWAGNPRSDPFETLYADFLKHAEGATPFAQDRYGGADPSHRIKTRVFTKLAWHSLFMRTRLPP
jgi:phosphoenolpyruvate carboxykinase (ATP)